MKRCPITYEEIPNNQTYSKKGIQQLSRRLTDLKVFNYSKEEQIEEAHKRVSKMSIQGVQPKLSGKLNVNDKTFEITTTGGKYILKPQNPSYPELPENEDLTMKLAALIDIETPTHGLLYSKDQSLTYFIKRFDRTIKSDKIHVEDFAQLSDQSRNTKYSSSMETVVKMMNTFCTFPAVEKLKLFNRTLFNYLIGNEDMHLKNFSIIHMDNHIKLTPAYDFLNTTIALKNPQEELALPLNGKKRNMKRQDFISYFGQEILGLSTQAIDTILNSLEHEIPNFDDLIEISFLSDNMKNKFKEILDSRRSILFS
ncbi:MAG: HipA domain-containing protein [Candidatus Margulisbacteria bacterium]|nr:HipA domain-containing protein [Candidatus Margulisiibacteriota bacterium]